jgi:hypothetical protein
VTVTQPSAIYVTTGDSRRGVLGFTWRIWPRGTSFYLKSGVPGMRHLKLSMHSDDPRHPAGGGFKLGMDTEESYRNAIDAGQALAVRGGQWPIWFPGAPQTDDATLVARLRWTWDACTRLGPAPEPGELTKDAVGLVAPVPGQPGDAMDVDLIVSKTKPYWRSEKRARRDNACLGPLANAAGDWLTGTIVRRLAAHYAPPDSLIAPRARSREDQLRGVAAGVDPTGFVWLIEQRMSRAGCRTAAAHRPQEREHDAH